MKRQGDKATRRQGEGARQLLFTRSPCLLVTLSFLIGCTNTSQTTSHWQGPLAPTPVSSAPWVYKGKPSKVLITEHYAIHTTITDREFLSTLSQLMEGAYGQ